MSDGEQNKEVPIDLPFIIGTICSVVIYIAIITGPAVRKGNAHIVMALMIGLPMWGLFEWRNPSDRKFLAGILVLFAMGALGFGGGSNRCHVEYDAHANPTVCE